VEAWADVLRQKRQAIFYGPPGTGKTFLSRHLARHLVGGGCGHWDLVQFHPSYAYEQFVEGLRPTRAESGALTYSQVEGRFLSFCQKARDCESDPQSTCVLIIDEINRANLSRVFGELMYLLEYRDREIQLASGRRFRIPENVTLIGTMNTADRSIALVDHALRRRFAFLPLWSNLELIRDYHASNETGVDVEPLVEQLTRINRAIDDRNYSVGPSYFLREDLADSLPWIWQFQIVPYLEEYFFSDPDTVEAYRWENVKTELTPLRR
jgi:5-methylcytosine-specific restriction protein B